MESADKPQAEKAEKSPLSPKEMAELLADDATAWRNLVIELVSCASYGMLVIAMTLAWILYVGWPR